MTTGLDEYDDGWKQTKNKRLQIVGMAYIQVICSAACNTRWRCLVAWIRRIIWIIRNNLPLIMPPPQWLFLSAYMHAHFTVHDVCVDKFCTRQCQCFKAHFSDSASTRTGVDTLVGDFLATAIYNWICTFHFQIFVCSFYWLNNVRCRHPFSSSIASQHIPSPWIVFSEASTRKIHKKIMLWLRRWTRTSGLSAKN